MTFRLRSLQLASLIILVTAAPGLASADLIVNINAGYYGYQESAANPAVGQVVTPVSEAPGGGLNQYVLTAGTYEVTNAYGQFGALYKAFHFNESNTGANWAWNFLISNASDGNKTVLFGTGAALGATADAVASQTSVTNFVAYFTLSTNAVLNFMIRDDEVGDNTGGVSLLVKQVARPGSELAPEPSSLVMVGIGTLASAGAIIRRRRRIERGSAA